MSPATSLIASALLTWVMLLVASLARSHGWTIPGMKIAFGNRDDLPEPTAFAGRAQRAAANMVENLALFAALLLGASLAGTTRDALVPGCTIFVISRVVYAPLYWAGVRYVRTLVWSVSLVGLAWIGALALGA
jgi:uncharacterized MAPEG superfamily protein